MIFFIISSLILQVLSENKPKCDFSDLTDAVSAYNRAQTEQCKIEIEQLACKSKLNPSNKEINNFINTKSKCPNSIRKQKGCIDTETFIQHIESSNPNHTFIFKPDVNDLNTCISTCLTNYHYKYAAFNEFRSNCSCFRVLNSLKTSLTDCYNTDDVFSIYETGLLKMPPNLINETYFIKNPNEEYLRLKINGEAPRIVFLFTLNGRSIRHVLRILKAIYDDYHFYYFHVDQRSGFLKRELSKLKFSNCYLSEWSMSTIWGGASLLQMHLKVMKELVDMKRSEKLNWDYILNLSETDFPIKTIQELTVYLAKNKEKNFLKFRSNYFENFVRNQGLEYVFNQCENRMWRIVNRSLPIGLQVDGGSDWFCLNYNFVDYVINSNDEYLFDLKLFYNYTLLPSESFFHTVILNSRFCHTVINSNLRFTNWNRERGCKCQYKHVVDWCGCSPNLFTRNDWLMIKELNNKPMFIARKFDHLFNSELINNIDQSLFGIYSANFKSLHSYWDNIYHFEDDVTMHEMKSKLIFSYFLSKSVNQFIDYIDMFSDYFLNSNDLITQLFQTKFDNIREVNAYFQADNFKGFIIQIEVNKIVYEAYFAKTANKQLIDINSNFKNSSQILIEKRDLLLKSMVKLEISSDFDAKERRFNNYASILDLNSNPSILILIDPIIESLKFKIVWIDPNDKIVKESQVNLNESDKSQLIINGFFRIDSSSANKSVYDLKTDGVWKIKLIVNENTDNVTVLTHTFLILPKLDKTFNLEYKSDLQLEQLAQKINKFWYLKDLCIKHELTSNLIRNEYLFIMNKLINNCESNSYWSSFYLDLKSNLSILNNYIDRL